MGRQYLTWNVDPVMFTISVNWQLIWTAICFVLGYYYLAAAAKSSGKREIQINTSIIWIMFGIIIGGRLGYGFITQASTLFQDPLGFFIRDAWNMDFEIKRPIRWYGLLFAMSFVVGSVIVSWMYRREGKSRETLDRLTFYLAIGTVVGARLGHSVFYNPEYYFSNPVRILRIWEGGLASHGAGIGLLLAVVYYSKVTKEFSFFWVFDRLTIVIAIGGCFIRLGNLMNSEILGKRTDSALGIIFKRVDSIPRHPVQLYESIVYLLLFFLLLSLYLGIARRLASGFLTGTAFVLSFSARFLIEFVKEEQAALRSEMILNMGQWLSIPMILFGIAVLRKSLKSST